MVDDINVLLSLCSAKRGKPKSAPGLLRELSMVFGRFVAPMTTTRCFRMRAILSKSVHSCVTMRPSLPVSFSSLAWQIESTSSMKMSTGRLVSFFAFLIASSKTLRSACSLSPRYALRISGPFTSVRNAFVFAAIERTSRVFPTPGSPALLKDRNDDSVYQKIRRRRRRRRERERLCRNSEREKKERNVNLLKVFHLQERHCIYDIPEGGKK